LALRTDFDKGSLVGFDVPLVTALDCYFIDFHGLKEWFWEGKRRFAYDTTPGDTGEAQHR
jgi:hypothetical protein